MPNATASARAQEAMSGFYSRETAATVIARLMTAGVGARFPSDLSFHEIGKAIARLCGNSDEWDHDNATRSIGDIAEYLLEADVSQKPSSIHADALLVVSELGICGHYPDYVSFRDLAVAIVFATQHAPGWGADAVSQIKAGMIEQKAWRPKL